jgi:branched-subunit amino acid aminotransferase/4-amino-4-deoxychorismate lyase
MDILVLVTPIRIYPAEYYAKGISVGLFEFQRHYAEIKAPFTYMGGLLAQNTIIKNGDYNEVLYTSNGRVLEGTTFSFFAINNNEVVLTPPTDGNILRSVTRLVLLNIMEEKEIKFEERDLPVDEVYSCKEAFIVSSTRDIVPIVSVANHTIGDGLVGASTKKLMEIYQEEIRKFIS